MRRIVLIAVVCAGVIFIRPTNSQTNGGQTLKKVAEFDLPGPHPNLFGCREAQRCLLGI
jgi:hypothetical protein